MKQKESNPTIQAINVFKTYGNICAVNDISFETYSGEIIALLGPNGAGKSTLMNMIAGYLTPSLGQIYVKGCSVEKDDLSTKKNIGFLPEGAPLYNDMTVKTYLKYFIELKLNSMIADTISKKEKQTLYQKELERIINIAKINDVTSQKIETLSKGYVRRVGFATSLIGNPDILLLDEPTDGLDPNQKDHMRKLITKMGKDKTIVISTHLLDEAKEIATRIILINKGKIVANGSVKEILSQTKKRSLEDAFRFLTVTGEDDE